MTGFIVRTSIAVATDRAGGSRDIGHDAVLVVMTVVTTIRGIGVRVACSGGGTAAATASEFGVEGYLQQVANLKTAATPATGSRDGWAWSTV